MRYDLQFLAHLASWVATPQTLYRAPFVTPPFAAAQFFARAARLQNEIAPEFFKIDTKNGLRNAKKDPKNDLKRVLKSMPNMTGRPGCWTMEMNGGSSAPYLACTPCVPLFVHCLIRVEAEGLLDYQGRAEIISIVQWNLRPVIFGVDKSLNPSHAA